MATDKLEKELLANPLFAGGLPVPTKPLPTDWYFVELNQHALDGYAIGCPSLDIKPVLVPHEVARAYEEWANWRTFAERSQIEPMERVTVLLGLMLRHEKLGQCVKAEPIALTTKG